VAISERAPLAYYSKVHVIDVSGIVDSWVPSSERMNHAQFMRRFAPSYAIVYGTSREWYFSSTLQYDRVMYFPKRGFEDFSLLMKR